METRPRGKRFAGAAERPEGVPRRRIDGDPDAPAGPVELVVGRVVAEHQLVGRNRLSLCAENLTTRPPGRWCFPSPLPLCNTDRVRDGSSRRPSGVHHDCHPARRLHRPGRAECTGSGHRRAASQTFSARVLAEIDTTRIQGNPVGLAWRADGTIYLRMTDGKDKRGTTWLPPSPRSPSARLTACRLGGHLLELEVRHGGAWRPIAEDRGRTVGRAESEREHARRRELAGMTSGVLPRRRRRRRVERRRRRGGQQHRHGGNVRARFKGQVVGEWSNEVPQLGMRFGWAPAPMGALAYVRRRGPPVRGRPRRPHGAGSRRRTARCCRPGRSTAGNSSVFRRRATRSTASCSPTSSRKGGSSVPGAFFGLRLAAGLSLACCSSPVPGARPGAAAVAVLRILSPTPARTPAAP